MTNSKIIAIDGPAASGKSTLGERLAEHLGVLYFDTGVMYRAVTYAALNSFSSVNDERAVTKLAEVIQIDARPPTVKDGRKFDVLLDHVDVTWQIRSSEVDASVSQVSAYAGVRKAMTEQQRRIADNAGSVVMVGRDIGTVVCPRADIKIFLDASIEERSRRRYEEIIHRGENACVEDILTSVRRRDEIDSTRVVAPLRPAIDALIIHTDALTEEQVFQKVKDLLKRG
jgi:CMP/dCMP kinase